MLEKSKIVVDKPFNKEFFKLFEKFSFKYWCRKKTENHQLSHLESEELWEKIKNSLQSFN